MNTPKQSPIQRDRQIIRTAVYDAMKDMVKGTTSRGKMVLILAKRHKIAPVTVNKYFRSEELRLAELAQMPTLGQDLMHGKQESINDYDFEEVTDSPSEGLETAQDYVKAIGGVTVDNFGHSDPTWPWEGLSGASIQIEQMERDVVIHMTVTISQEEMGDTILGLMTKSNVGFTSKLIG